MAGVLKTRFEYGDDIPMIAASPVTAGRLAKYAASQALGKGTQGKPAVEHTAAAGDYAVGAVRYDATTGADVTITRRQTVMLLEVGSGAGVAAGDAVGPGGTGAGTIQTTTGAGRFEIGRALHAAAASGFVWVLVHGFPGVFRP